MKRRRPREHTRHYRKYGFVRLINEGISYPVMVYQRVVKNPFPEEPVKIKKAVIEGSLPELAETVLNKANIQREVQELAKELMEKKIDEDEFRKQKLELEKSKEKRLFEQWTAKKQGEFKPLAATEMLDKAQEGGENKGFQEALALLEARGQIATGVGEQRILKEVAPRDQVVAMTWAAKDYTDSDLADRALTSLLGEEKNRLIHMRKFKETWEKSSRFPEDMAKFQEVMKKYDEEKNPIRKQELEVEGQRLWGLVYGPRVEYETFKNSWIKEVDRAEKMAKVSKMDIKAKLTGLNKYLTEMNPFYEKLNKKALGDRIKTELLAGAARSALNIVSNAVSHKVNKYLIESSIKKDFKKQAIATAEAHAAMIKDAYRIGAIPRDEARMNLRNVRNNLKYKLILAKAGLQSTGGN